MPRPPRGGGLGGERLRGTGVGVGGVGVGEVLRALPAHCCCCGGRRRGACGLCESFSRFRGVLGVAAWPAKAVARLAGAAVATPRAPSPLSSAAAAAPGDAPGSCAGATPRVGSVPGAAVGAAAWLAGAAVSASCASGAPSRGGRQGLLLGRRGRSPRLAQAPGPAAAARPALPPPPASAPRAPRGSPPSTLGRQESWSGTGGGGGRPAGKSHRSLPSLFSW